MPKADLVLESGRVFLGLELGFAEAIALWSGRVLAVGTALEIAPLIGPDTRVIDLRGRLALPGFNDNHQHLMSLGMALGEVDLRPAEVTTLEELLRRIEARAAAAAPGAWIFGGRYDHFHLDVKRHPLAWEIDTVAPDNPVYIKRTCGHVGVANSRALALAGIDETTPDPEGGHIERENGRLTGQLQERAQELVLRQIPPAPLDDLIAGIEAGGRAMLSQGITSVMDAGVGMRQGYDDFLAYQEARRQCRLPLRAYLSLVGGPAGIQERALANGLRSGVGDDFLKIGSVKLFTDGAAGSGTAAMKSPYRCGCDRFGMLIYDTPDLNAYVADYHAQGNQVSLHAIGDAAIEQAIEAVAQAQAKHPASDRRHRIEHCGFITPAQIVAMKRLGIYPAPQPIFIYEFGDLYVEALGEDRPARSYPMKTWMERGMHPAASSDAPVSSSNPMTNLYTMVTRETASGRVLGADQALTMAQAVSALTYNGAFVSFCEDEKGTLAPGRLADLAVLDRDIFAIPIAEVLEARVDVTILDGRVVHVREGIEPG